MSAIVSKTASKKKSTKTSRHVTPVSAEAVIQNVTPPTQPSQEVSAPSPTLATSIVALAPAIAAASPITPPGDLPPDAGAPATPDDWSPMPGSLRRGDRPKGAQISHAVAAANELTRSKTYVEDFGSRAPAAAQVAFVVGNAAKWRHLWQGAKKFLAYATEQRAAWENDALAQMDALKPVFTYATSRDASVAEKYSATAKFLGEKSAIAARGATTRKAKAKAKGAAATASPSSPSPAPEAAEPAAPVAAK